jgi:WD40 repeat protein
VAVDPASGAVAVARAADVEVHDLASHTARAAVRVGRPEALAARPPFVALLEEGGARVWDVSGRRAPLMVRATVRPSAIALSDDGRLLAIGDYGGGVRVWATGGRARLWDQDGGPGAGAVVSLAFDPAGRRLAVVTRAVLSAFHQGSLVRADVSIRSATTGEEETSVTLGSAPCAAVFARSGTAWVVAEDGKAAPVAPDPAGYARSHNTRCVVARDPTRDVVATSAGGEIVLRGLADGGAALRTLSDIPSVEQIAFSDDGKRLAAALHGGDLAIWDLAGYALIARRPNAALDAAGLAFSPDGASIFVASRDGALQRLSLATAGPTLTLFGLHGDQAGFAIDREGRVEVFGGGERALLCGFGAVSFPFELCRHRFEKAGVLAGP